MSKPTESAPPAAWMVEAGYEIADGLHPHYADRAAAIIARHAPASEEPLKLRAALEHAREWLAEEGCDCGTGDPPCALCEADAALSNAPAPEEREEKCPHGYPPGYPDCCDPTPAPAPASPTVADHEFEADPDSIHRGGEVCFKCGLPRSAHPAAAPEPLGHKFWKGHSRHDRCRILLAGEKTCGEPEAAHAPAPSVQPAMNRGVDWGSGESYSVEVKLPMKLESAAPSVQPGLPHRNRAGRYLVVRQENVSEEFPNVDVYRCTVCGQESMQPDAVYSEEVERQAEPWKFEKPEPAAQDRLAEAAERLRLDLDIPADEAEDARRRIRAELERVVRATANLAPRDVDTRAALRYWDLK